MVSTDVVRATLLLAIPALWLSDALSLPALLAIMVAFGAASVVNDAASMAFLPWLVPGHALQRAHARIDGADAVAQVAGPAAGGLLVRWLGAPIAVLTDACTYLLSAVVVAVLRVEEPQPARAERRHLGREILEGVRWTYGGSGLAPLAASAHVWFVGNAVLGAVFAPFVLVTLGLGPERLGFALAAAGLGAIVGTAITTWIGARLGPGRTIIACDLLSGCAVLGMLAASAIDAPLAATIVLAAGQLLHGVAMGASNSHEMTFRQLRTPGRLQARVNITMRSINRTMIVIAAPIGGVVADLAGMGVALGLAAGALVAAAVVLTASPFRRAVGYAGDEREHRPDSHE